MLKKRIILFVAILLPTFSTLVAQHQLSLEDCRKLAIENNKKLKIADEQVQVAYYEKRDALTKYFPDLSFSGGYMRNQKNIRLIDPSVIPTEIHTPPVTLPPAWGGTNIPSLTLPIGDIRDKLLDATELKVKNMWDLGFHLTQPIFTGGKIIALNDIRSHAEALAKTMKETQVTNTLVEVDQAYWQIVSLSNKQELAQSYVESLTKMESDISAMETEGVATKADRLSVNVKLNEAEMVLTKANNGLSLSKMLLAQICGLEISDKLTLADEGSKSLSQMAYTLETINPEEALANRTEIKSLEIANKIYDKQEKIATANFLPTIGLKANYGWTNPNSYKGFKNQFGGQWSVGIGVTVPLNFVSSSAKLNVAKAQTRIKKFELEEAKEKIILQVNQESYKLAEADKKQKAALKNSEKADENLRYANLGFEEGVITATDALLAHTAWISAHSELIDAQIDLKLCKVYLDKALGRNIQK